MQIVSPILFRVRDAPRQGQDHFSAPNMQINVNHRACFRKLLYVYVDIVDPAGRDAIERRRSRLVAVDHRKIAMGNGRSSKSTRSDAVSADIGEVATSVTNRMLWRVIGSKFKL